MSNDTSYSVCRIEKAKAANNNCAGSLKRRYEHNTRVYTPPNVDTSLSYLNKELIPLQEASYVAAYEAEIQQAVAKGDMTKVRKDAVLGVEVVFNYTNKENANVDIDNWAKDTVEWAKKKFGEHNIKHATLHMDEECGPHIHVFFIPMNEKNRLSYKSFVNGPAACSRMQTEYAKDVGSKYGLERGVRYSSLPSKTMHDYKRATLGKAVVKKEDIEPREDERDLTSGLILPQYVDRMQKTLETNNFKHLAQVNELIQKNNEEMSLHIQAEIEAKKEKEKYREKLKKLADLMGKLKERILTEKISVKELEKMINRYDLLERGLKSYPDREQAKKIADELNKIAEWQHNQDKEKKLKVEKEIGF